MKTLNIGPLLVIIVAVCFLGGCTPLGPANGTNTSGASSASPGATPNLSPYSGWVDLHDCQEVRGWVWKGSAPETSAKVELYIDGKLTETLTAETLRPDLASKLGTGRYGFSFKIPATYRDSKPHEVKVKVVESDYVLPFYQGVPATETCGP